MNADSLQLAEDLHARRRDLDMVVRAVHRLIRYTEPRPLFEAIARVGADALGTDKCAIYVKPADRDVLTIAGSLGLTGDLVKFIGERGIPLDTSLFTAVSYREQRPVSCSDVLEDSTLPREYVAASVADGFRSLLSCPVIAEGESLGVLTVYFKEARAFHPDEVRRLSLLAEVCAVAIRNARAFDETRRISDELAAKAEILERRNAELRIIADLAPTLAVAESPRQVLAAFHSHTFVHVPFEQVGVLMLDPANLKEIVIRDVFSTSPASFGRGWRTAWDGTLAEEPLVARKATFRQLSPATDHGPIGQYCLRLGLRSVAFFPVMAGREVRGLIILGSVRPDALSAETVTMLEPIVAHVASALAKLESALV
ncbi:MAG: GAF domain-containing protein [Candidatus Sericytochromatia bacterium]|nr:GAF domain-containing protein [Candidatus Tanganyikabacteria bacterium]